VQIGSEQKSHDVRETVYIINHQSIKKAIIHTFTVSHNFSIGKMGVRRGRSQQEQKRASEGGGQKHTSGG